jgi:DNA replication protein DnaC
MVTDDNRGNPSSWTEDDEKALLLRIAQRRCDLAREHQRNNVASIPAIAWTPTRDLGDTWNTNVEKLRQKATRLASDKLATRYTCEMCRDTGWRSVLDGETERVRRCECRGAALREVVGIPATFAAAEFSTLKRDAGNRVGVQALDEWFAGKRRDLYFFGPTGVGKTHLGCVALNEARLRGARCLFLHVPTFILANLQAFDDSERKARVNELFERAATLDVVLLDDVAGGEKPSDYTRSLMTVMYERRRAVAGCRTIWTSNLALHELITFYGDERLPSRIAEECGQKLTELGGADVRLQPMRFKVVGGRGR